MKNLLLVFLLGFVLHLTASCTENNYMPEIETFYFEKEDTAEITDSLGDDSIADSKELVLNPNGPEISLYAHNSKSNQSAAIYGDYVFLISQGRGLIHIYNIRNKSLVNTIKLPVSDENSYYGNDLYHSNQATFGTEFYAFDDPFPLLYISQRARSDLRCFVEVFRIIPEYNEKGDAYKSIDAFLVQTIYFPPMTKENSLGNVNCAIDREKNLIYTYSRNNNKTDDN